MFALAAFAGFCLGSAIRSVAQPVSETFRIDADGVPGSVVTAIGEDLEWAEARISEALGRFPETVSVQVFPGRESFTAALRAAWGIPETACWMVGAADDRSLYLLSPAAWEEEACEHDASDVEHRRLLVAHEAVHVYHGQVNPSADIGLLEDIGWFVEGLATYVSGQLEARHSGRAAEAVAAGEAPARLEDAWSGPYRYGVSGSLVAYIDAAWGRETLREALAAVSADELMKLLATDEEELLVGWRAWLRGE
jgi:hypothetical protein